MTEKAAADKNTLIVMATHGCSGIQRWPLGSVADKVIHGATNHLFLVRASEQGKTDGEAALKTVIVPLDGSALAEQVLPVRRRPRKKNEAQSGSYASLTRCRPLFPQRTTGFTRLTCWIILSLRRATIFKGK